MNNWYGISHVMLWIFLIIQFGIILYFGRIVGEFLNRFRLSVNSGSKIRENKLQVGNSIPHFREKNHRGDIIDSLKRTDGYCLLVFLSNTCPQCKEVLQELSVFSKQLSLQIWVFNSHNFGEYIAKDIPNVHYIQSSKVMVDFFINSVPYMMLINESNIIIHSDNKIKLSSLEKYLPKHKESIV